MKFNSKKLFISGLILIGLALLLPLFLSLGISLLIAVIVAVAFYLLFAGSDNGGDSDDTADEKEPDEAEAGIESLLMLNIELRKCIMPEAVRDQFEQIIDQLIALLPGINQAGAEGELAWVINRMATEYLPEKSVRPYIKLNESARHEEATITSVEEGLAGMKAELTEVETILASRQNSEFNAKAKFLKQRFKL